MTEITLFYMKYDSKTGCKSSANTTEILIISHLTLSQSSLEVEAFHSPSSILHKNHSKQ